MTMNDLPVIGYPCLRKELWDRQGANSAKSLEGNVRQKKNHFGEWSTLFRRRFIAKEFGQCLKCGKCKFLYE